MKKIVTLWSAPMKGLMVTLLVVLGSGSSFAQQYGGNEFSADRSDNQRSSLRTNQTRLQPLTRSFDRTSMRVAQSSSTGDSGFSPTSSQIIGGTDPKEGSSPTKVVPITTSDRNQSDGLYNDQMNRAGQTSSRMNRRDSSTMDAGRNQNDGLYGGQMNQGSQPSGRMDRRDSSTMNAGRGFDSQQATPQTSSVRRQTSAQAPQSNGQLRAWPLPVSPEWETTLKIEGYIYAPIKPHEQNSIGEVVMFQDSSQFGNRSATGSNVTSNQWEVYKNTAIIDVNEFSLREIQKGTLTLRNLGVENLTGVALRYVRDDGSKIDVRRIGNIPGNSSAIQVASQNDFGQNQPIANRGTRPNERQFNSQQAPDVSFNNRNPRRDTLAQDTINDGLWDINENQQVRRPRQSRRTFQDDDRSISQRDSRDRFAGDSRDLPRSSNRRLRDDYLDNLQRRDFDQRDQRDANYVRNRINQDRDDDYLSRGNALSSRYPYDTRFDEDQYSRSNRTFYDRRDGRSLDFDANFASQQRELQERLLDAKRLEVKNAEDAAWLKRQRESMEEARLAQLYDDDLTPLRMRTSIGSNYPYGLGAERLADRSTDPSYNGLGSRAVTRSSDLDASVERVVRELNEREATILTKVEVAKHLSKLNPIEKDLDDEIERLKKERNGSSSGGKIQSLVSRTMPDTLGGDLAAPRYTRLSANGNSTAYDGLNSRAPLLDINGYKHRGPQTQGASAFGGEPASGSSDGRMLRLMWLLLLISLGANIYLAMLSRSFYTQYEELADELRETFSRSSSTI